MSDLQQWQHFLRKLDGHVASCIIDTAWIERGADPKRPLLVKITFAVKSLDDFGLPEPEESEALDEFEDVLSAALEDVPGAAHVATVTTQGRRHWYVYAKADKGIVDVGRGLAATHPAYPLSVTSRNDPDWEAYDEVLPTDEEVRLNGDMMVIAQLESAGDPCTASRPIEHLAVFDVKDRAEAFVQWLSNNGYAPGDIERDGREWLVHFTNEGVPNIEAITEITRELAEAAERAGGEYDGWQCRVLSE